MHIAETILHKFGNQDIAFLNIHLVGIYFGNLVLENVSQGGNRYGDIQSFSANNLALVLYINNFKIQDPFLYHFAEHGKSEWDSGTLLTSMVPTSSQGISSLTNAHIVCDRYILPD